MELKRKIIASPKEGQEPSTNQLCDAKIGSNSRSPNFGKVNVEEFNKASSDFDEIQVTVENSGKGHERPRKLHGSKKRTGTISNFNFKVVDLAQKMAILKHF